MTKKIDINDKEQMKKDLLDRPDDIMARLGNTLNNFGSIEDIQKKAAQFEKFVIDSLHILDENDKKLNAKIDKILGILQEAKDAYEQSAGNQE